MVRPANAPEIGHPARDGHIAKIAAAMDEDAVGKEGREQSEIQVVVGHLVDDPIGPALIECLEGFEVLLGQAADGRLIEVGDAVQGELGTVEQLGDGLERLAGQPQFARPVDLRVAGEHLLDQGRARPGQTEDEHRPARVQPHAGGALKEGRIELSQEVIDEELVIGRDVLPAVAGPAPGGAQLACRRQSAARA